MTDRIHSLETLHTSLVDSRNGYEEALEDADGKGLTPLFREMIALRASAIDELGRDLAALGRPLDESGSLMSTVHRTVMSVRSLFSGLDESVLPGLIDGEERIIANYDRAIAASAAGNVEYAHLTAQKAVLQAKIAGMRAMKAHAGV